MRRKHPRRLSNAPERVGTNPRSIRAPSVAKIDRRPPNSGPIAWTGGPRALRRTTPGALTGAGAGGGRLEVTKRSRATTPRRCCWAHLPFFRAPTSKEAGRMMHVCWVDRSAPPCLTAAPTAPFLASAQASHRSDARSGRLLCARFRLVLAVGRRQRLSLKKLGERVLLCTLHP